MTTMSIPILFAANVLLTDDAVLERAPPYLEGECSYMELRQDEVGGHHVTLGIEVLAPNGKLKVGEKPGETTYIQWCMLGPEEPVMVNSFPRGAPQ